MKLTKLPGIFLDVKGVITSYKIHVTISILKYTNALICDCIYIYIGELNYLECLWKMSNETFLSKLPTSLKKLSKICIQTFM